MVKSNRKTNKIKYNIYNNNLRNIHNIDDNVPVFSDTVMGLG